MTIVSQEQAKAGLIELVANLHDIRQQKNALDKLEKTLLEEIKPLVDPEFDRLRDEDHETKMPITIGSLDLLRVAGTSRSIQADLLLERGVSPDVVGYATKTTTYYSYRVKEAK